MNESRNFEVVCRGCGIVRVLQLPDDVEQPPPVECYECKECSADRSVLDHPEAIQELIEGMQTGRQRIYRFLASVMGHRKGGFVDYADGSFENIHGYKPYRRERVKTTARQWRQDNPGRQTEYKRLWRQGYRARDQRRDDPDGYENRSLKLAADCVEWQAKVERLGCSCSFCGQVLTKETAIRWSIQDGEKGVEDLIPICRGCRGKKAAEKRWKKAA